MITNAVYRSLARFNKYYTFMDENITYYIASILDPWIKGAWIRKQHASGDEKLKEVRTSIHKLYLPGDQVHDPITSNSTVDNDNPLSILHEIIGELRQDQDNDTSPTAFISDIDRYLDFPTIDGDGIEDADWVLNWWRDHEKEYPIMSQVARDYLPIQAAEVDVERLFSGGRDLVGLQRHSLSDETMKVLMILKHSQQFNNLVI
jgi:hypothetical protein